MREGARELKSPADAKALVRLLKRQEHNSVYPFARLGRGRVEQQLFRRVGRSHGLGHDDNPWPVVVPDVVREVMGHCADVVGGEESALIGGTSPNLPAGWTG